MRGCPSLVGSEHERDELLEVSGSRRAREIVDHEICRGVTGDTHGMAPTCGWVWQQPRLKRRHKPRDWTVFTRRSFAGWNHRVQFSVTVRLSVPPALASGIEDDSVVPVAVIAGAVVVSSAV